MSAQNFKDLTVYKKAFDLAMKIYSASKSFPNEEKYSLTDQIRRSSRSVAVCIAEAYRKRKYEAHFISKTTDSDMENSETQVWLDFALACNYMDKKVKEDLEQKSIEVGKLLNHMLNYPQKYINRNNQ
jgi:four helix bundle protein